MNKKATQ